MKRGEEKGADSPLALVYADKENRAVIMVRKRGRTRRTKNAVSLREEGRLNGEGEALEVYRCPG